VFKLVGKGLQGVENNHREKGVRKEKGVQEERGFKGQKRF
jgi:hypothetical protein